MWVGCKWLPGLNDRVRQEHRRAMTTAKMNREQLVGLCGIVLATALTLIAMLVVNS
jgi:hypothetical protein